MGKNVKHATKMRPGSKGSKPSTTFAKLGIISGLGLTCVMALQWYLSSSAVLPEPSQAAPIKAAPQKKKPQQSKFADMSSVMGTKGERAKIPDALKHSSVEWTTLPRDLPGCITAQEELMTVPVRGSSARHNCGRGC